MKTQPKIYAIRDKLTGEYCVFGSKCAWISKGAAKNAFHNHFRCYVNWEDKYFDEQTQYEIMEI